MFKNLFNFSFVIMLIFSTTEIVAQENSLTVHVGNVKSSNGEIHIGVYKSQEGYPYDKEICTVYRFKAVKGVSTYTIKNIKAGYYAMAIYHDENDNDKCDTNFFGYPLEGYCFSNRKDIIDILPPSFETAKVKVSGASHTNANIIYKSFFN